MTATKTRKRAMTWRWWALLILGLVIAVGTIVWLGALDDDDGVPLIENPGAIVAVLLGSVTSILAVVLPQVLEIKHQVKNDHPQNFRDDIDGKHTTILKIVEAIAADVRGVRRDVGRNADATAYQGQRLDKLTERVDGLEDFQPHHPSDL